MSNEDRQLIRYVHSGDVLTSPGHARLTVCIDITGFNAALRQAQHALQGYAVPMTRSPEQYGEIIEHEAGQGQ